MASPSKVSSISLTDVNLDDPDLVVASFDRTALLNMLNSSNDPKAVLYFEKSDAGGDNPYVARIAPANSSGTIDAGAGLQSAQLPCPPYCRPRGG